ACVSSSALPEAGFSGRSDRSIGPSTSGWSRALARPQSTTRVSPYLPSMMLPGLRSRCSTRRLWAYAIALHTSTNRPSTLRNSTVRSPGSRAGPSPVEALRDLLEGVPFDKAPAPAQFMAKFRGPLARIPRGAFLPVEALDDLLEGVPFDKAHGVVRSAVGVLAEAVDRDDARVLQPSRNLRLQDEAAAFVLVI